MKRITAVFTASLVMVSILFSAAVPHSVLAKKKAAKKNSKKVSITLSKSTDTMAKGTTFTFKAKVKNAKASQVVWRSSDSKVISIKKKTGKATAKKAGKAIISATIKKQLVRMTVTVSPVLSDLVEANNTYENLKTGIFTSVAGTATTNTPGEDKNTVYREYACLDEANNIQLYQTVENSYFTYVNAGKKYTIDYLSEDNITTEDFSEADNPDNNFTAYSNAELISAAVNPDQTYTLIYMADIGGMTAEEQASVGLNDGTFVMTAIVEPKHLLVQSYKITNYGANGASASVVSGTFTYNTDNELTVPEKIQSMISPGEESAESAEEENAPN